MLKHGMKEGKTVIQLQSGEIDHIHHINSDIALELCNITLFHGYMTQITQLVCR